MRAIVVPLLLAVLLSSAATFGGCFAVVPGPPGGEGSDGGTGGSGPLEAQTKDISVVCVNTLTQDYEALDWELTVEPVLDPGGGPLLAASFDGVARFEESYLDTAQAVVPGGVKEVNLLDLRATVAAYAGGTGADAVLTIEPVDYQCTSPPTRPACDPTNDLPDGDLRCQDGPCAGFPGRTGNSDCEPIRNDNPCGRFLAIPTSDECTRGGTCWNLDRDEACATPEDFCKPEAKTQCQTNGFCVTGDLELQLESTIQEYTANSSDPLVFGWYEPDRQGTWTFPTGLFDDPTGPTGLRLLVGTLPVGIECVLGAETDPDFARVPDEDLISFQIERTCADGTEFCPFGFTITNDGKCLLSIQGSLSTKEDPSGVSACSEPPNAYVIESFLALDDSSILQSNSLAVKATVTAKNVEDASCLADGKIIGGVNYLDAQRQIIESDTYVFVSTSELAVSHVSPRMRSTLVWFREEVPWSTGEAVCCERTFQTTWSVTVGQCEGW